jgi:TIR domain
LSSNPPFAGFHIFLSYRREGTSAHAYRLHDFLIRGVDQQPGFADEQVFMDIDTIPPGDDFRRVIADAVAKCDVLLAVIGREWTTVKDESGRRRLSNPADWVRLEVEAALKREVPVVPVLVDGATMPKKSELPKSIADLAFRNAVELSDSRWRDDVGRLLTSLKKREDTKANADPQRTTRTPQQQGTAAKSTAATSPAAKPSKRKIVRRRLYRVGDVYHGRIERLEGPVATAAKPFERKLARKGPPTVVRHWAKVLIDPETYAKLPGHLEFARQGKTSTPKVRTAGGHLVGVGDVISVKIESVPRPVLDAGESIRVSSVGMMPPHTRVGPAT